MRRFSHAPAFTLLELLVVVAIIVILLALLMPGLDKALDSAQTTKCMAQFEGMQTALGQFLIDNSYVMPHHRTERDKNGAAVGAGTPEEIWWGVELLKYGLVPESFHCPNLDKGQVDYGLTWDWSFDAHFVGYGYNAYFLGVFPYAQDDYSNSSLKSTKIVSPSECMLFGESNPRPVEKVWSMSLWAPTASNQGGGYEGINDARHMRGGVVVFNDGSTEVMKKEEINPNLPEAQWHQDPNTRKYWDAMRKLPPAP